MPNAAQSDALGPEIAKLNCRTRMAYNCDMGRAAFGFYLGPPLGGLVFTFALFAVQSGAQVLTNMGLAKYTAAAYFFTFFATTVAQYWFWFSAPNCPITIHENGVRYKSRKLLFEDILGVMIGSGQVEDVRLGFSVTPVGRVRNAMKMAETAHQNAVNCSIQLVTRRGNVIISKGLVLYEQADLEQLITTINEKQAESSGMAAPSYA